ncbi:MAG: hypothetical protein Q8K92_19985 [Leadbetterella sp.]|nr:hypothetical protein [Leadbetterella sp.]
MITITDVLYNIRHSAVTFSIEYRKLDGTSSTKQGVLGSVKPPIDGCIVLFQGRQPFSIYIDFIVRFDNITVKH